MAANRRWTRTAMTAVMVFTCGAIGTRAQQPVTGSARSDEVEQPRVRILSPQMAHGFREGLSRSATFRRLIDAIDASDGIVYVEYGVCKSGARGCLLGTLVIAGPSRMLRVLIQKTQSGDELVVSLGHELQHAIEVLSDRTVTTSAQMQFLFRKIGVQYGGMFETLEAMRVTDAIRLELAASARRGDDARSR